MPLKTGPYDAANYLDSDAAIAAYLSEAMETNDAGLIADAIGAVARARGMSEIAESAGVSRPSLYRALSADGNPELDTVLRVLGAFNVGLAAVPQAAGRRAATAAKSARKPAVHRRKAGTAYAAAVMAKR
jgi:probable addiction module antidote protein